MQPPVTTASDRTDGNDGDAPDAQPDDAHAAGGQEYHLVARNLVARTGDVIVTIVTAAMKGSGWGGQDESRIIRAERNGPSLTRSSDGLGRGAGTAPVERNVTG